MDCPEAKEGSIETVLLPNNPAFVEQPLPWSHLFELARLFQACNQEQRKKVNLTSWAQVAANTDNPADLQDLLLTNGGGDRVARISAGVKEIFKQTEREGLPLLQRLVGCSIELKSPKNKVFIPRLNPPDFAKANQLNRSYGADQFIHIRLDEQLCKHLRSRGNKHFIQRAFKRFVHAPIRIGDRLFFFVLRKENHIWLVSAPNPGWESTKRFINDVLDLKLNKEMTVAKWVARTSLLLSATNSSIDVDPQDIRRVPDIYSDSLIISRDLLCLVADTLGLGYLPSCVEGLIRNKPLVWRLGIPSEDDKHLIQLWDDQIGKASKHIFIKFRARRYDHFQKTFVLTEEPVVVLLEKCLSMGARPQGKAEIMTDGAGIISRAAATRVCETIGWSCDTLPSAYQARIGFAKGLWILPPQLHSQDVNPWVEIRDSQWKAETVKGYHFHFNLNRISRAVASSNLGKQLLPILATRGVRADSVCTILDDYIKTTISDLNSNDPLRLTEVLNRGGALRSSRKIILNRLAGLQHDSTGSRTFRDDESADADIVHGYKESWALTQDNLHHLSLSPIQCEEQVVSMLAAGFEPSNRYLVTRLRKIKQDKITSAIKFKIPISQSAFVYVIPDPTGTLREDEAFLQFSNFKDDSIGIKISTLICPAIVSRSPCVSSIDVRKINLVDNDNLRETYFDVLVCSIQGKRSLLSLLSGGDYDGDQVTVIWNSTLTQQFHNVNVEKHPRINTDHLFGPVQRGTVEECLLGAYEKNAQQFVKVAQSMQLAGLFTPNDAGSYSSKHVMAEYLFGLDHPLTQKLGDVYVRCLDAPKAGLRLLDANDRRLKKEFETALSKVTFPNGKNIVQIPFKKQPIPMYLRDDPKFSLGGSANVIQFELGGKAHILDKLLKTGYAIWNLYKKELDSKDIATHKERCNDRDEDLSQYFTEHKKMYEFNKTDRGSRDVWIGVLRPLQRALHHIPSEWGKEVREGRNENLRDKIWESEYGPGTGSSGKQCKPTFTVQKTYMELSYEKAFEHKPEPEDVELYKINMDEFQTNIKLFLEGLGPTGYALLKASCLSMNSNPEAFCPYDLAFREVCYLKAMASQTKKTNNSILNHFPSKAVMELMASRPPRPITTTGYLASVVKSGTILGRSKSDGQNLEPV